MAFFLFTSYILLFHVRCDSLPPGHLGGAVLSQNAIVDISSSLFQFNRARSGGAIIAITSIMTLTNITVVNNTAYQGSGIFAFGNVAQVSSLTITSSSFSDNISEESGCISIGDHVQLLVTDTNWDRNTCGSFGAAVAVGTESTALFNQVKHTIATMSKTLYVRACLIRKPLALIFAVTAFADANI
jgi:hypothetical protein